MNAFKRSIINFHILTPLLFCLPLVSRATYYKNHAVVEGNLQFVGALTGENAPFLAVNNPLGTRKMPHVKFK